jgi:hypothetical protein
VKPWQRFKSWFKRKSAELTPTGPDADQPFREFVYLDDVSVDSLVASVRGSTLDQITETKASELQAEVASTIGVSNVVTSAEIRSRLQSTASDGLQTLRRVGIQARFRELHEIVGARRALYPVDDDDVPKVGTAAEIRTVAEHHGGRWAIPVSGLSRGDVVEVDVELGADPLFHMIAAMHQMLELWPEDPELLGLGRLPDQDKAQAMSNMLSAMLGGLVPIRSRAVDLDTVLLDGEPWLVHRRLLDQIPPGEPTSRRPLNVVGVASESRFWKDQRRVVFAGARYRILARLVRDGTSQSWSPIKMVDTFKDLAPGFAEGVDEATRQGEALLRANEPAAALTPADRTVAGNARAIAEAFAQDLGEKVGVTITALELDEAALYPSEVASVPSLAACRSLLDPIAAYIQELADVTVEPNVVSDVRLAAYQRVVDFSGRTEVGMGAADEKPDLLEVEFIAIYW